MAGSHTPSGVSRTLVILDDDSPARRLLYHALKDRFRVLEAWDADSALDHLARERVDLMLVELHLSPRAAAPDEGLRAQRRVRESAPGLPVVVVPANGHPHLREELLAQGVRAVLPKPVDVAALMRALEELAGA